MKICLGNFKNKLDKKQTLALISQYDKTKLQNVGFAVLPQFFDEVSNSDVFILQQNCNLKEINSSCRGKTFVVGHSDYRKAGESNKIVVKKVRKLLKFGANVVFCCGETSSEFEQGKTIRVVEKQIKPLKKLDKSRIVVAYEPIYAIGTGKVANMIDVLPVIKVIKQVLVGIKVLYGGSVNSKNAGKILSKKDIDGVLVGKSCLDVQEFCKICATRK